MVINEKARKKGRIGDGDSKQKFTEAKRGVVRGEKRKK
jgi:hypothetical protein